MVVRMKKDYKLIHRFKDPDEAETKLREMLERKELIMEFGHRVYKTSDPRSAIIKDWSKKLSIQNNDTHLFPK
ncbi:citrate/2-methylcitrate synthase [Coxiella-like endosymbiont]|uniref:citrate/2-methylcitrate synthase n=1 Tax=Coxiella-like endosymbiont TaxID=1592897 RepID=UPI00272D05E3|nr:citrate/2-methylcitrate synthase [Coxiella-like endosymbiont]